PQHEPEVVDHLGDGRDEDAGDGAEEHGQREGHAACSHDADAAETGAQPVDGRCSERLAPQRAAEEVPQTGQQQSADAEQPQVLPVEANGSEAHAAPLERRDGVGLWPPERQTEAGQSQVQADGHDEEHQHRRPRQRLDDDAITDRPEGGGKQDSYQDHYYIGQGRPGGGHDQQRGGSGSCQRRDTGPQGAQRSAESQLGDDVVDGPQHQTSHDEVDSARYLPCSQAGDAQGGQHHELTLRNVDDTGDGGEDHGA